MENLKYCKSCKEWKPRTTEFFHKKSDTKDGLNYRCMDCVSEYNRQYYLKKGAGLIEPVKVKSNHLRMSTVAKYPIESGATYQIDALVRRSLVKKDFIGVLYSMTDIHATFINKYGRRETFLKVDFLLGTYRLKKL